MYATVQDISFYRLESRAVPVERLSVIREHLPDIEAVTTLTQGNMENSIELMVERGFDYFTMNVTVAKDTK